MASPAKQPVGSSITCESLIRTRRMNKTESFLLEERLKVLDSKKNQKYAELNLEKHSLKKRIEEIRSVRKNSGIGAERRKLLRSQGYTTNTRTPLNDSDDVPVAFKRFSMPEISCSDLSALRSPKLNTHKSEPVMKAFSQINIHGSAETEREITGEEQRKNSSVMTRSRVRHQFRVIEPPCRPGSRRNFVQLSNDKLKEFTEKEEKQSGETFDPNVRVDHRGVILPPKLAKTSKNTTQAEVKADESPGQARMLPISEKQICQDKQKKNTQSDQVLFGQGKQAWTENLYFENKSRTEENSSFPAVEQKLRSNSCDCADRLTEVRASDSPSDFHNSESISRDVITPGSHHVDRKSIIATNNNSELRQKQASTRPPARVAFVEAQEGMTNMERQGHLRVTSHDNRNESRQPKEQHVGNVETESRDSRLRGDSSESNVNEQTQLPREKPVELWKKRRVTVPPGKLNIAPPDHKVVPRHDGGKSEPKKLSGASLSPNVRKKSALSLHSEQHPQDDSVTYAYDARPGRSLCKGYVTMQMTVKGKQVKVHIPKFPHDSESEPVIERLRKKVSIDRSEPRSLQEKQTLKDGERAEA